MLCQARHANLTLDVQAPAVPAAEGLNMPATPGMALSTPAMSAPAAILPAASTALSVIAAQSGIQLDAHQIAEKWGHPNGLVNHAEPKQVLPRYPSAVLQDGAK